MARTVTSSPGVQRLTSLVATLLVAVTTAIAFARVYEGGAVTVQFVLVAVLSGALAWTLERRGLLVATLASASVLVVVLGLVAFRETTWYGFPAADTLREMWAAAGAVSEQARLQTAPAPPIDPLVLAGVVATWASVFSCHALAFRAGSPLLALVPPVALVAFADTVLEDAIRPQYGVAFLVGALAVVFADALRRAQSWGPLWSGRPGRGRSVLGAASGGARRLAVAVIAVAAFVPLTLPGFGSSGLIDISSVGDNDRLLVDPLVSIASELTRDEEVEVLRVRSEVPAYLRMITLDTFDGITWHRSADDDAGRMISGSLAPSDPAVESFSQDVTVETDLGFPWLPMAADTTHVLVPAAARWDAGSATITLDEPLDAGTPYTTTSDLHQPSPDELLRGDVGLDPVTRATYLALPGDLPAAIEERARAWIAEAGARSAYEQAIAIQERLRAFTYDTDVALRDDSSTLVTFLYETQRGFCQQFASAMAVMLRSVGIPARVAVGFTEGVADPDERGARTVSTENLHSWVEVPFEGHGWLAFEPTPNRDNPVAQTYQDPTSAASCGPRACPGELRGAGGRNPADGPELDEIPDRRAEFSEGDLGALPAPGTAADPRSELRRRALVAVGIAALLSVATVPLVRMLRRRHRLRRARGEPRRMVLATYDVFSQRAADMGVGREVGETPLEYLRRLEASDRLDDGHLARLTALATRAAYAPADIGQDDVLDAEADAREVLRSLRRSATPVRRLVGAYRRS